MCCSIGSRPRERTSTSTPPRCTAGSSSGERRPGRRGGRGRVWRCSGWPKLARRLDWRALLLASAAAACGLAVALALVDGVQGLTSPLEANTEYVLAERGRTSARRGRSSRRSSTASATTASTSRVIRPACCCCSRAWTGSARRLRMGRGAVHRRGAAAIPAVLIAVREVAGEEIARRASPFLVITPAAIWIATSADAFFMG